ncbi:MAG: class I SAM-dependent methyltransferase [Rhizobiaceae bacterium]|nr:class I SAM-dependent methyltransferase [Rhizobiaceae bacterium]
MTFRQKWDSASYQTHTGFVPVLGEGVLELLNAQSDEHILDLGCGDGALTEKILLTGATVIGVDSSESFVSSAKLRGIDARIIDGHELNFDREFDAVFSNAALHWMLKPQLVADNVSLALKPGGRFVGEFGGFGNVAAICTAMRAVAKLMNGDQTLTAPWYFPADNEYQQILLQAGFSNIKISSYYRPTPLPTGMAGWLQVFRQPFFEQFGDRADEALNQVVDLLKPSLCDESGNWIADYVRLKFTADYAGNSL